MSPSSAKRTSQGTVSPADRAPEVFEPGTPIGLHLRVHRLVVREADRHVYLVNDTNPRWHTKKCWNCGFRYSAKTAQSCGYCATPLRPRRFLMTARWDAASNEAFLSFTRRRVKHARIRTPLALYHYHRQLLAIYAWDHEQLLCEQPAPIAARTLLPALFCLADGLSALHAHGVVLKHLNARHVLTNASGAHQLFDLQVATLLDHPVEVSDDLTLPPLRDIRDLCASLGTYCEPNDGELEAFLQMARRGRWKTADRLAGATSAFAQRPAHHALPRATKRHEVAAQSGGGTHGSQRVDARLWKPLTDELTVYLLADGSSTNLSGNEAAWAATQSCMLEMERNLQDAPFQKRRAPDLLTSGLEAAHKRVHELYKTSKVRGGASLLVVLHYATDTEQRVWIAHVGDARACLFRDGALEKLTTDQTVVGQLVAQGKLSAAAAPQHPQSGVLLQTIGGDMTLQPQMVDRPLLPGDRLLLCNQTLVRHLGDGHITSLLANDADARQVVRWLTRRATLRGHGENTTALLIDVKPG